MYDIKKLHLVRGFDSKSTGVTDQVYSALVDGIIDGTLQGGEQLLQVELQKHFCVSPSPIREALRKLEKKGLVEIVPRKGAHVKKIRLSDFKNCFSVRSVLEGLAAKEAHIKMKEETRVKLIGTFEKLETAAIRNDAELVRQQLFLFHKIFILASGNNQLIDTLRNVPIHLMWKQFLWKYTKKDLVSVTKRYKKILKMFIDRKFDIFELENYIKSHIIWSGNRFIKFLTNEGKIN